MRIVDVVTGLFLQHHAHNEVDDFRSRSAVANDVTQRMLHGREKAGANLTVGGQPDARAGATESFGDGSDDADFSGRAVGKAKTRSGFGTASNIHRFEPVALFNALANRAA